MEALYTVLTALASATALFLLTKLMGEKHISQMTLFDYVVGITIGSIAGNTATDPESLLNGVVAMAVYVLLAVGTALASRKSLLLRRYLAGHPVVLYHNGALYRDNFRKVHLDLSDFLMICRVAGYFDLKDIHTAILETNGDVSFLPVADKRPLTPGDMGQAPTQTHVLTNVILDGHITPDNLISTGHDENWLRKELKAQGYSSHREVMYACVAEDGTLSVYPIDTAKKPPIRFE